MKDVDTLTANFTEVEGQIYTTSRVRLCDIVAPSDLILIISPRKVHVSGFT